MHFLTLTRILTTWLLLSAVPQILFTLYWVCAFRPKKPVVNNERTLPKAGILMSLRGGDDELAESIRRLLRQDYPDFEMHIVIDSREDPAWAIVEGVIAENAYTKVFIEPLRERPRTASPHAASLAQAGESAMKTCEVLCCVDGDVVAHPHWLKTLVLACNDERIGMVNGNRWYCPADGQWGSLVRYCWNSAAVVGMYVFRIPWNGSCAMRRDDMQRAGVLDGWRTTLSADNASKVCLSRIGKTIGFVPELMMPNRDALSLSNCSDFLLRQMTWTKLYAPFGSWAMLLLHGLVGTALQWTVTCLAIYGLVAGNREIALTAGWGIVLYFAVLLALMLWIESTVRRSFRNRGDHEPGWLSMKIFLRLVPAILLTQFVYSIALLQATYRRRVTWRKVVYELKGPWNSCVLDDESQLPDTTAAS